MSIRSISTTCNACELFTTYDVPPLPLEDASGALESFQDALIENIFFYFKAVLKIRNKGDLVI